MKNLRMNINEAPGNIASGAKKPLHGKEENCMHLFVIVISLLLMFSNVGECAQPTSSLPATLTAQSSGCLDCHREQTPGIYQEWGYSRHYRSNVGCFECHGAGSKEPDAMEHNGYIISVIVSPKDCSGCHEKESGEFQS